MNRNGAEKLRFTIGIYAMMLVSAFCTSAQGTLKLEVIYEHKWQKVVEACCRMADRYYGAQLRMRNNRYGKWCDAG